MRKPETRPEAGSRTRDATKGGKSTFRVPRTSSELRIKRGKNSVRYRSLRKYLSDLGSRHLRSPVMSRIEQIPALPSDTVHSMSMPKKTSRIQSAAAILSSVKKEMAKPRIVESARKEADTLANGGHIAVLTHEEAVRKARARKILLNYGTKLAS
jgi:hypothetical protein